ncbi:MAG: VanW family protein [Pseudomonadota bacterium]
MNRSSTTSRGSEFNLLKIAASGALGFAVLGSIFLGLYFWGVFRADRERQQLVTAVEVAPEQTADLHARLAAAAKESLETPLGLKLGDKKKEISWRELGFVVDESVLASQALRLHRRGVDAESVGAGYYREGQATPIPLRPERARALDILLSLSVYFDEPATNAKLALEERKVIPEKPGRVLDAYRSLAALEESARAGKSEVVLVSSEIAPAVTREQLGGIDISSVLGWFETHYPPVEKDRNYNLRLAGSKLNGHVLVPGEEFSFNAVVGERTEKQGYRVAHVIAAGEMVDGLAGGACQISSTLHAAAWFAGLDIVFSTPHSRPSAYITMGLDATVVYPSVDLKLRNPYDFPVAIRYVVSQGTVRAEILGRARPYDKITFERAVQKEIPFEQEVREDGSLPVGSTIVDQPGFNGYELMRYRRFYRDNQVIKTNKWRVRYPPTTEFVRVGTNPNPKLRPPTQPKHHLPQGPGKSKRFSMSQ